MENSYHLFWKSRDQDCFAPIDEFETLDQAMQRAYHHADDSKMVWSIYDGFYIARKGLHAKDSISVGEYLANGKTDEYLIFYEYPSDYDQFPVYTMSSEVNDEN